MNDLTGKRFGYLVVQHKDYRIRKDDVRESFWVCLCDCGRITNTVTRNLVTGKSKSCGCHRFTTKPFESLYKRLKRSAERRNILLTISFEQFLDIIENNKVCFYCHSVLEWNDRLGPDRKFAYNVDRKDVNLGYTLDNCVAACPRCNIGKSFYWTFDEWYRMTECWRENA